MQAKLRFLRTPKKGARSNLHTTMKYLRDPLFVKPVEKDLIFAAKMSS